MSKKMSRRQMLKKSSLVAGVGLAAQMTATRRAVAAAEKRPENEPFGYCLNTSTIRGQKLSLVEEIEIAAKAGYDAIEPWIGEIKDYVKEGGQLKDLKKRISDLGLTVESAIGFASWIVDDAEERRRGLKTAQHDMDLVRRIGGTRLAAPPVGATKQTDLDLLKAAQRYRTLLDLGEKMDVVPQVEVWGFSKSLHRLGQAVFVAIESGHPAACILPDVYHIYKGGSDFAGLNLINGQAIGVFHFNDYPATPVRSRMNDSHRVYTGDGVAPLGTIIRDIHKAGFRGYLSLELFNKDYWKQDALSVAKTGLRKLRTVVKKSLS